MYVQIIHTQKYPYLKTIFILCIHRHTPIPTHRHNYTQKTPDIYTHTQTHMYTHRYNIVYITHQKYSIYMYIVYIIHVHVSLDT